MSGPSGNLGFDPNKPPLDLPGLEETEVSNETKLDAIDFSGVEEGESLLLEKGLFEEVTPEQLGIDALYPSSVGLENLTEVENETLVAGEIVYSLEAEKIVLPLPQGVYKNESSHTSLQRLAEATNSALNSDKIFVSKESIEKTLSFKNTILEKTSHPAIKIALDLMETAPEQVEKSPVARSLVEVSSFLGTQDIFLNHIEALKKIPDPEILSLNTQRRLQTVGNHVGAIIDANISMDNLVKKIEVFFGVDLEVVLEKMVKDSGEEAPASPIKDKKIQNPLSEYLSELKEGVEHQKAHVSSKREMYSEEDYLRAIGSAVAVYRDILYEMQMEDTVVSNNLIEGQMNLIEERKQLDLSKIEMAFKKRKNLTKVFLAVGIVMAVLAAIVLVLSIIVPFLAPVSIGMIATAVSLGTGMAIAGSMMIVQSVKGSDPLQEAFKRMVDELQMDMTDQVAMVATLFAVSVILSIISAGAFTSSVGASSSMAVQAGMAFTMIAAQQGLGLTASLFSMVVTERIREALLKIEGVSEKTAMAIAMVSTMLMVILSSVLGQPGAVKEIPNMSLKAVLQASARNVFTNIKFFYEAPRMILRNSVQMFMDTSKSASAITKTILHSIRLSMKNISMSAKSAREIVMKEMLQAFGRMMSHAAVMIMRGAKMVFVNTPLDIARGLLATLKATIATKQLGVNILMPVQAMTQLIVAAETYKVKMAEIKLVKEKAAYNAQLSKFSAALDALKMVNASLMESFNPQTIVTVSQAYTQIIEDMRQIAGAAASKTEVRTARAIHASSDSVKKTIPTKAEEVKSFETRESVNQKISSEKIEQHASSQTEAAIDAQAEVEFQKVVKNMTPSAQALLASFSAAPQNVLSKNVLTTKMPSTAEISQKLLLFALHSMMKDRLYGQFKTMGVPEEAAKHFADTFAYQFIELMAFFAADPEKLSQGADIEKFIQDPDFLTQTMLFAFNEKKEGIPLLLENLLTQALPTVPSYETKEFLSLIEMMAVNDPELQAQLVLLQKLQTEGISSPFQFAYFSHAVMLSWVMRHAFEQDKKEKQGLEPKSIADEITSTLALLLGSGTPVGGKRNPGMESLWDSLYRE